MTVSSPSSWTMGYSHISAFPVRMRTTLSGQSEPVWLRFAHVEQVRQVQEVRDGEPSARKAAMGRSIERLWLETSVIGALRSTPAV